MLLVGKSTNSVGGCESCKISNGRPALVAPCAFTAVTNNVALDKMNPPSKKIQDAQLRKDALVSARLPLDKPDQCNEDVLNRILWRAAMGAKPYPEWAVKVVDED